MKEEMMKHRILRGVLGLGLGFASMAQAELLNISSNALQSQNTETSGCTIVGSGGKSYRGIKVLIVMAEGNSADSDPVLTVKTLNTQSPTVIVNDNWRESSTENGASRSASDFSSFLRSPGKPTDAGFAVFVSPGVALCAFSREKSGGDTLRSVSISITDVTDRIQGAALYEIESKYQSEVSGSESGLIAGLVR
jgi:hypothetical protein